MEANLELFATQFVWVCSCCKSRYDAFWRPTEKNKKAYRPPVTYLWTEDKPTWNYCPTCGAQFGKELPGGEAASELRI